MSHIVFSTPVIVPSPAPSWVQALQAAEEMGAHSLWRGLRLSLLPWPLAFGEGHGRLGTSPGNRQGGGHRRGNRQGSWLLGHVDIWQEVMIYMENSCRNKSVVNYG